MRKLGIIGVLSVLVVALAAVPALAITNFDNAPQGAHYRQGFAEPVCNLVQSGTTFTLDCTGTQIAGVGNTNADLSVELTATANFVCHNPGNDNIVEPHSGTVSDSVDVTLTPSRNGTLVVDPQHLEISAADAAAQFTCPNPNWREEFTGFSATSFTYSLTFAGFTEPAILITGP